MLGFIIGTIVGSAIGSMVGIFAVCMLMAGREKE